MTRRRSIRWAAIAAGLVAVYALVGFFAIPPIARSQIVAFARRTLHREATVARVRFNPFTLAGAIEGFELKDPDGVVAIRFDSLAVDLQISGVFRRAYRFREVALDRPFVGARLLSSGSFSLADLFTSDAAAPPGTGRAALPRVIVDRLVVHGGRADFLDETRSPRFVQTFEPLDLEVHELTTLPDEAGDHAVTIGFEQGARFRWNGTQTVDPLHLEGRVEVTGLPLSRVWSYVAPAHALEVSDGRTDITFAYDIHRTSAGPLSFAVHDATIAARDITARAVDGGEHWLDVGAVEVTGVSASWPEHRAQIASVRIVEPKVLVRRSAGRDVNWLTAFAAPQAAGAATTGAAPASPAPAPWTATIAAVDLSGGAVTLDDSAVTPKATTTLTEVTAHVERVSTDLKAAVPARVAMTVNGSGHVEVSGAIAPDPGAGDLDLAVRGIDLTPFQQYSVHLPGAQLRHGVGGLAGHLRLSPAAPTLTFEGTASIDAVRLSGAGEDRLIAWDRARMRGIRATLAPDRIRMTEVQFDGAFMKLRIDRAGNVNVASITRGARDAAAPAAAAAAAKAGPSPAVEISHVIINNATADYTDESLILPFHTAIRALNGDIRDVSSTAAAPARLTVEGRVAETGFVKADGTLRVAEPLAATDVTVAFRNVNMPDLTPYAAEFAGYSLDKGSLDLDVQYQVHARRLIGDHKMVAKDLVLGPKVAGAKGPGLPIRLAVALLKDKNGRIDIDVPVEGDIDSPDFNYRAVFWRAFRTILLHIVEAPFRFLGRLFGGGGDDELELVGFVAGRTDLVAPEQDKLTKVAGELAGRTDIALEIEGRYDPVADVDALKRARLEAKIDARRAPDVSLDAILEAVYAQTFSSDRLESERQRLMPAAAGAAPDAALRPAFYEELRKQLLAAETIGPDELPALGRARGAAIAAALEAGGLDASRVTVLEAKPVTKKKQGSDLVASEMTMAEKG